MLCRKTCSFNRGSHLPARKAQTKAPFCVGLWEAGNDDPEGKNARQPQAVPTMAQALFTCAHSIPKCLRLAAPVAISTPC